MSDIVWANDTRTLADLVPWEHNPKVMSKKQADGLRVSLEKFGFAVPFLVGPDNAIYDGHQRDTLMQAMRQYGPKAVVDVRVSSRPLTDDERRELVVRLKQAQAGWDFEALPNLYEKEELIEWGFELGELGLFPADDLPEDPGAQIDRAEELREKWQTAPGQLWQLGEHRVICGDCTDAGVVARVMGGDRFDLAITSPPYNSGDGGYKTDYYGKTKHFYLDKIDDRTEPEWVAFCESALSVCGDHCREETSVVIWNVMYTARARAGYGLVMFGGRQPFTVKETICWDKGMGFPTASKGILSRNWELVFVLSKGDKYNTTQNENEVRWAKWDISRPGEQSESNKATFPIDLAERAINDFSTLNSVVFDPFLGSGTTLIACERLGRRCRGVEISPAYVAVTLQRWADYSGQTPVMVTDA